MRLNRSNIIAVTIEPLIFALFYLFQVNTVFYYLYLGVTPFLFFLACFYIEDIRAVLSRTLLHKDFFYFASFLAIWLFMYAATKNGPLYVFETAYYPVFLEEFNFRFILIMLLKRRFNPGQAIVIQALLYALFYSSFLVFYPSGFPGIFTELFILDNFSMAILYGFIYYFRKNFYIPLTIHMSLYLVSVFLPASLGWIPQVTTPV